MYGSFYYEKGHMALYWHCLDQVLVRKSLVNIINNMEQRTHFLLQQQYKTGEYI